MISVCNVENQDNSAMLLVFVLAVVLPVSTSFWIVTLLFSASNEGTDTFEFFLEVHIGKNWSLLKCQVVISFTDGYREGLFLYEIRFCSYPFWSSLSRVVFICGY